MLVAVDGDTIVGHLQITGTSRPDVSDIKNMTVDPARQRGGIGRSLVAGAVAPARRRSRSTLTRPAWTSTASNCMTASGSTGASTHDPCPTLRAGPNADPFGTCAAAAAVKAHRVIAE